MSDRTSTPSADSTTPSPPDRSRHPVSHFALPPDLSAKAAPAQVSTDEAHFRAIATSLARTTTELSERLDDARRAPGGAGRQALDRDLEVHRLTARLRALRRFGVDLCLGRMVPQGATEPVYVGRLGLTDEDGRRLLVDWRSPAAEPFFGATHADPMGLRSRRRYRWTRGSVSDYWDEVFTSDDLKGQVALDDQSAFIASLSASRSARMRDVLGTIQADQDAIIRAGSKGALVVDGGPGTGKTVVALHRTAYLLYADPRLGHRRGGVLFVGPHQPYLAYVADVLPSLGEEGVRTCTIRDLVPEGATASPEPDPRVGRLKAALDVAAVIEAAVRFYEDAPGAPVTITTPWAEVSLGPDDWATALAAPDPGTPHNEARDQVLDELVTLVQEKVDDDEVSPDLLRAFLLRDRVLLESLNAAWPMIEPTDLVGDLWSVPAFLRLCSPGLTRDEIRLLQRRETHAWTDADLPYLDLARHRLGDAQGSRLRRRRQAEDRAEREQMSRVIDDLIAADDDHEGLVTMLRHPDLRENFVDEDTRAGPRADELAGPFAHVVVDEAQELTDAQWQMLVARCPSRSFTIVGDRAQARHGFTESWQERLVRIGLGHPTVASLTINYRTPEEVMREAEPQIRAVLPDANVPTSIRSTGLPVRHGATRDLDDVLEAWARTHPEGTACVIGDPSRPEGPRVRSLTAELSKGLEFDLVVLVDPQAFGGGIEGAVDRYVAMTRSTRELVVLTGAPGSG